MKLSFVVPAYNEEHYIGKCLDSILKETAQSPVPCEVIVVNNASTDRTAEVVQRYPSVKLVNETEKGLPKARQAGFDASTGDLIANVDADAVLPHGWITTVIKEFADDPRLVALSGPHVYYDLGKTTRAFMKIFYAIAYVAYFLNRFIFRNSSLVQGGNFVVTRTGMEKIGGFNTKIHFYGEDTDLGLRLNKVGHVKFTFELPITISGRRVAKEGLLTMGLRYGINFFWIIFFKRPFHTSRETFVRPDTSEGLAYTPTSPTREFVIGIFSAVVVISLMIGMAYGAYLLALRVIFK